MNLVIRPDIRAKMAKAQQRRYAGHRVVLTCNECGQNYYEYLSNIKRRKPRFCSTKCYKNWMSKHVYPNWHKKALTEVSCLYCGKTVAVPRSIAKTKKFCSMKCRNRWDSEHPNHLLLYLPKPNKAEVRLNSFLQAYFPNEWEYTGDGKVVLNGLIPDFTNKNGRKAVIELFGDYWHGEKASSWKDTELGKIMVYKALGFECLVIWEKELKDEQQVVAKVSSFEKIVCSHHHGK